MQPKVFEYCVMLLGKESSDTSNSLQKKLKQIHVKYPTGYSDGNLK